MKSISFSDAMILAILDGRKTVTRRLMKPQPGKHGIQVCTSSPTGYAYNSGIMPNRCSCVPVPCPYRPGETVYVKEVWGVIDLESGYSLRYQPQSKYDDTEVIYRAGCDDFTDSLVHKWFSPATMPEWASRLKITFIGVRAERIQDITENDLVEEGANGPVPTIQGGEIGESGPPSFVHGFREIWESLYPGSWDKNEWVWRYKFEVTE
jgi:hypothetical protein